MLNDNFRIWQAFVFANNSISSTVKQLPAEIHATTSSGTGETAYKYVLCSSTAFGNLYGNLSSNIMLFGSGSTPAAVTDASLESPFSTTTEINTTYTGSVSVANHSMVITLVCKVRNKKATSITISEMAWIRFMSLTNTAGASSGTNLPVVMARQVLDTPVTLDPGEEHIFTMKLVV